MAHSQYPAAHLNRLPQRQMRDAIEVALGESAQRDEVTAAGYRAALESLSVAMPMQIQRLRQLASAGLVAATARFDDTIRLLDVLDAPAISTCAIREDASWPGVIFAGCLGPGDAARNAWIARMLGRGAIIVSSDMSASLAVIASRLNAGSARPSTRSRVAVSDDLAEILSQDGALSRLIAEMRPAVRLAAGHVPLSLAQPFGTQLIARDAISDAPIVVVASVAGGQVLHSVAHWWQDGSPDVTEMGRRSLATVPAFAELGRQHRDARLAGFGAGVVMLGSLLAGLDVALARARWHVALPEVVGFIEGD